MNKHVCVLLAAYNGEVWLKEQIDSILKQKNVKVDIYISLDVSNDNSIQILTEYENRINILPYGEVFGSAGQNFFRLIIDVDFSKYDYVAFSDQDDIWFDEKLIRAIDKLDYHKADGYSSNIIAFWNKDNCKLIKKDYPQKEYDYLFEAAGPGCSIVLTKKIILDIQDILKNNIKKSKKLWLHDWFIYSFARENRYKWFIDKEPYMLYRQHNNNVVGANKGLNAIIRRIRIVLFGDAINNVIYQAEFINNKSNIIRLLKDNSFCSYFKLAFYARKCRRKFLDQILFFISMICLAIKKLIG
ncbi:glycosyltransferase [Photobacterium damselae]